MEDAAAAVAALLAAGPQSAEEVAMASPVVVDAPPPVEMAAAALRQLFLDLEQETGGLGFSHLSGAPRGEEDAGCPPPCTGSMTPWRGQSELVAAQVPRGDAIPVGGPAASPALPAAATTPLANAMFTAASNAGSGGGAGAKRKSPLSDHYLETLLAGEGQSPTTDVRAKNVPEELTKFLSQHPTLWFTNEQLADRLSHTSSGIRNAVTKLKGTGLVQTRMSGTLAFRAWHTAQPNDSLPPNLPFHKKLATRACNHCGTGESRYWRSDLLNPNKWLCNSCGMSQRRGKDRLNARAEGSPATTSPVTGGPQGAPKRSKKKKPTPSDTASRDEGRGSPSQEESENMRLMRMLRLHTSMAPLAPNPAMAVLAAAHTGPSTPRLSSARSSSSDLPHGVVAGGGATWHATSANTTPLLPAYPPTPEVEVMGGYTFSHEHRRRNDSGYIQESVISKEGCTLARTLSLAECQRCHEHLPVLKLEQCHHSFCGECIPFLIHSCSPSAATAGPNPAPSSMDMAVGPCITCSACMAEEEGKANTTPVRLAPAWAEEGGKGYVPSTVPVSLLGNFMDHLMMMHAPAAS